MPEMKPVRLSRHARENMTFRGASEEEVVTAIRDGTWQPAGAGRVEVRRDSEYNRDWNGRAYGTKQVRPIFVDEKDEIVVVTVYVYYF
jgi:hypothetical protein